MSSIGSLLSPQPGDAGRIRAVDAGHPAVFHVDGDIREPGEQGGVVHDPDHRRAPVAALGQELGHVVLQ